MGVSTEATKILVPTGALGTGLKAEDVERGIIAGAHVIACDAGSTDSGPAYLATGSPKYSRDAIKADLKILVRAQAKARIPLLIGSCGTSGCDIAVDLTRDIVLEIVEEFDLSPKIVVLYSEQDAATMISYAEAGQITPLAPMEAVNSTVFRECSHIVALMGPEPYIAALNAGADIILGGRTTDTAVLAAVPLWHGHDRAACWHAGKIAECGGLCTVDPRNGGILLTVSGDSFVVEPLALENRCTAYTVSGHMLYENSDPIRLIEPGGIVDVSNAIYEGIDDRRVRVSGASFLPMPYTMKLEGAGSDSFQTIMFVGIRDRGVLAEIDRFIEGMHRTLVERVDEAMGSMVGNYDISLRPYGWNAVTGRTEQTQPAIPEEIGLLFVATAETQELANRIAKTCNPWLFHMPIDPGIELPSYAFPFSPAEIDRGAVHSFKLNYVVHVKDPLELVRMVYVASGMSDNAQA